MRPSSWAVFETEKIGVLYYIERCDSVSAFCLCCRLKFSQEFHGCGSVISIGFNVIWLQVDVCHLIKSTMIENIYGCSCIYSHSKLVSLYFHSNMRDFFCRLGRVHRAKVRRQHYFLCPCSHFPAAVVCRLVEDQVSCDMMICVVSPS